MSDTPDFTRNSGPAVDKIESAPQVLEHEQGLTDVRRLTRPGATMAKAKFTASAPSRGSLDRADPRHGTNAGYNLGCREHCCRHAHMVSVKRWRLYGGTLVPAHGFTRRVRALQALGYTSRELSALIGRSKSFVDATVDQPKIRRSTHDAMVNLYDRLSMTIPTGWVADRARRRSKDFGYAPPLAWSDIDDPDDLPSGVAYDPATPSRAAA